MKAFMLTAIVIVCMVACKKGSNPASPVFFGKWEVRRTYGGFIIPPDSVYKPGNGNILQLNSDSTYESYTKNKLSGQGVFHIRKNAFKSGPNTYDELYYDSDTSFNSVIFFNGDTLTIRPTIPDIGTTAYLNIQD
jgi:hypothetical protein